MRTSVLLLWSIACTGAPPQTPEPVAPPPVIEEPASPAPLIVPNVVVDAPNYAASHVLISWQGATRSTTVRTKAEARRLADDLWAQAKDGSRIEDLARAHSNAPSSARGGDLGVYLPGTMAEPFEKAIASVQPGELAPLVETEFGFHVARRDAVRQVHVAHIQVGEVDPLTATPRSGEQQRDRVQRALIALDDGVAWEQVVREYSDVTEVPGGDLGIIAPGQLPPAFERAAFSLAPGEISKPVSTSAGLHIIRRID